jgi:hypothetical protein
MNCLTSGKSELSYLFTKTVIKLIAVITETYHCCQLHTKLYPIFFSRITRYAYEITWHHKCGFRRNRSTTDQNFYIRQILEKKREYNIAAHQLFIDFKKSYDSVRRESVIQYSQ